jgi:hypothetical protein
VVGNLAWTTESQPPQPADRSATFDLRNSFGPILALRPIQFPTVREVRIAVAGQTEGVL